jgi:hypothetical protein
MASRDPDNGLYQLVAENGGDLHRQKVFRLAQVGSEEKNTASSKIVRARQACAVLLCWICSEHTGRLVE